MSGELKVEERERQRANAPDPSIPPGHTLMPTAERRKTCTGHVERQSVCVSMHVYIYMCVCVVGVGGCPHNVALLKLYIFAQY